MDVGPSGFNNVAPTTREERLAAKNKDDLEKRRIAARLQTHPQAPTDFRLPPVLNPVVPPKNSPMFIEEHDRFDRDVAGDIQRQKFTALQKREMMYEQRRHDRYNREKSKWDSQEQQLQREESRYQQLRQQGLGARRNQSGMSYNILTLDYNADTKGHALAQQDAHQRERTQLRAINLYQKSHSVTHNIITGQLLQPINPTTYQAAPPASC